MRNLSILFRLSRKQNVLSGMSLFLKTFADRVSTERFVRKLSGVSQTELQREASRLPNIPVAFQYAYAITRFYNKGGAKGVLPIAKLTAAMADG